MKSLEKRLEKIERYSKRENRLPVQIAIIRVDGSVWIKGSDSQDSVELSSMDELRSWMQETEESTGRPCKVYTIKSQGKEPDIL